MLRFRAPHLLKRLAASALLLTVTAHGFAPTALAVDFDVTGSLDCGVMSGHRCSFTDWETGPVLAIFTEDVSGKLMRFEVDASWVRDQLTSVRQDDFVWLLVRDGIGVLPRAVGVVEHRCADGRFPHGRVNHGASTRDRCR